MGLLRVKGREVSVLVSVSVSIFIWSSSAKCAMVACVMEDVGR